MIARPCISILAVSLAALSACSQTVPLASIQSPSGVVAVTKADDSTPAVVSLGTATTPLTGLENPSVLAEQRSGNGIAMLITGKADDCADSLLLVAADTSGPDVHKVGCHESWTLLDDMANTLTLRVGYPARIWTVQNGRISGPGADPEPPPPMPEPVRHRHGHRHKAVVRTTLLQKVQKIAAFGPAPVEKPKAPRAPEKAAVAPPAHPTFDPTADKS